MRRRVTSTDVAKQAGVSRSAVSRSFTPGASVSTETRKRVIQAAEKLGYRRNALAASLSKNSTDLVAVVMRDLANPFEAHLFAHISAGLQTIHRRALMVPVVDEADVEPRLLDALSYPVAAAIVAAGSVSEETAGTCVGLGIPMVLCGRALEADGVDSVWCDNASGIRGAIDALVRSRHERIAYIGGPSRVFSDIERFGAFRAALAERDMPVHAKDHGDFSFVSGYRAALAMLRAADPPDAIFCCNDAMALGALDAARHTMGLPVPEALSIIGFDDIPMAAWPSYQLTTVRNPVEAMVHELVELLVRRIDNPQAPPEIRRLQPVLVRRASARMLSAAPVPTPGATHA